MIPDQWERKLDPMVTQNIIARAAKIDPTLKDAPVIRQFVGLRPGRHAVRLEKEVVNDTVVIHDYGHGGIGYTLSWGCAEAVASIVANL